MNAVRAATGLRSRMGLCVVSPGRCLGVARRVLPVAGVALVVVLSAGAVAGARSSSGLSHRVLLSRSKPVRAVPPPASVAAVLEKTQQARYLVLSEESGSGPSRYVIDSRDRRAESWTGASVSLVQIGRRVYGPGPKAGCFVSARRSTALLPNVAGMLLPNGIAALHYTATGRTIRWSIKTSGSYQPHGRVRLDAAGRIVAATVYSGPGVPLTAIVSYPVKRPRITAPSRLCGKVRASGGVVAR